MYRNPANSAFQQKLQLGLMLSIAMRSVQIMLHLIVAIRTRGYKFIFLDHYLLSNCNIMHIWLKYINIFWTKQKLPHVSYIHYTVYNPRMLPTVHFCTISKLIPTHVPCILYTLLLTIKLSRHHLSFGFWPDNKSALADYSLKGYLASLRTNIGQHQDQLGGGSLQGKTSLGK